MEKKNTIAMIGFIIGVANYCCCCCGGLLFGAVGLVCSIIGYNNTKTGVYPEKYNYHIYAVAGIALNAVAFISCIIIGILQVFTGCISILANIF